MKKISVTFSLAKWARLTGIPASTLNYRIRRGFSPEAAITTPNTARDKGIWQAAEAAGLPPSVVYRRLSYGWSFDRALKTPKRFRGEKWTYNGVTKTIVQWATDVGLSYGALANRIKVMRWSIERALTTPKLRQGHKK